MSDDNTIIYATAVLFSPEGKTIIDKPVTTGNLDGLLPSKRTEEMAAAFFTKKKFRVTVTSPSLSVSGTKALFEKVFKFSVALKKVNGETYATALTRPVIPPELKSFVKTIVFSEPLEYFG